MKALGKKSFEQKIRKATDDYMQKNYRELTYRAVAEAAPYLVKQTEAMMLFALSKHGFGAKRLKEFHEWFKIAAEMPANIMGKTPKVEDCENLLAKKYGLKLDTVRLNFPTYEEFCRQEQNDASP